MLLDNALDGYPDDLDAFVEGLSTCTSDYYSSSLKVSALACLIHSNACCLTGHPFLLSFFDEISLFLSHQHHQQRAW
jgi:hypothetical protein